MAIDVYQKKKKKETSEGGSDKRNLKRENDKQTEVKGKVDAGRRQGTPTEKSSRPRGPQREEGNGLSRQASHYKWIR